MVSRMMIINAVRHCDLGIETRQQLFRFANSRLFAVSTIEFILEDGCLELKFHVRCVVLPSLRWGILRFGESWCVIWNLVFIERDILVLYTQHWKEWNALWQGNSYITTDGCHRKGRASKYFEPGWDASSERKCLKSSDNLRLTVGSLLKVPCAKFSWTFFLESVTLHVTILLCLITRKRFEIWNNLACLIYTPFQLVNSVHYFVR